MEVIHDSPSQSSLTPLSEHQSQTPESFYSGPPVLYHHSPKTLLKIHRSDLEASPALYKLADDQPNGTNGADSQTELSIPDIDVWVVSDKFTLWRPSLRTGVSITYPSISLHAVQTLSTNPPTQGLYLQLATGDPLDDPDAPEASIALTLVPDSSQSIAEPPRAETNSTGTETPQKPIDALFAALSACANLHPDPVSQDNSGDEEEDYGYAGENGEEGDGEGVFEYQVLGGQDGLPPPMPGSGGWITAENMGEFFDEEGNWRGRGLGPGAGLVRERDGEEDGVRDEGVDGEDAKWRRTS